MESTSPPELETAEPIQIDRDINCIQCGYNLRTISTQGNCPECGELVQTTISKSALEKWPLNAERACSLLAISSFLIVFCGIGIPAFLCGSIMLAREYRKRMDASTFFPWTIFLSVGLIPIVILSYALFDIPHLMLWPIFVLIAFNYIATLALGIRLCQDAHFDTPKLLCGVLIPLGCFILLSTSSPFAMFQGKEIIGILAIIIWWALLTLTWTVISVALLKRCDPIRYPKHF